MNAMLASFSSIIVIILMIVLGYILRVKNWFSDSFSKDIANLITKIALPASVFVSVLKHLTRNKLLNLGINIIFPILTFAFAYLFAFILVKALKIKPGRKGVFVNTIVNANAVFIGMPLNQALFGPKAMGYYLLFYIINTISLWGIGVFIIQKDDPTQKKAGKFDWKKLLPMPLVGFVVAVIWLIFEIPLPHFANQTLTYVGSLVTPLSLMYIGISLADSGLKNFNIERDTIVALIGKFIMFPAIMFILLLGGQNLFAMQIPHLLKQAFMVQAVMPSAAVIPILAKESHGDVAFATDVTVLGTILFIVIVPIVLAII